jgi:hypothetical protein
LIKIENHSALKEWAAVAAALEAGEQIVLVRKGGIADPKFGVEASRFLLLPTYLHQREKQFRDEHRHFFHETDIQDDSAPTVAVRIWCEAVETFRIAELDRLLALRPFVIFTDETIRERLSFRPEQAVHVIAVRGHRLPQSVRVVNKPEYAGCRSWISVDEEIDISGSQPVLDDETFAARLAELREALSLARAV